MTISPISNDQELLKKVASGDERAFDLIYHAYAKKIYAFAIKILRSPTLAEEVVQEVMLKIWRIGPEQSKINNLDAYLRTASRNVSLNILRKQAAEDKADEFLRLNWEEEHNDTEELVILNETRNILNVAIAQLPPQQREVYMLCHQQGLKYEEAAEKLGLAPSTVATHMKLALKFLRTYLKKHNVVSVLLIIFKLF